MLIRQSLFVVVLVACLLPVISLAQDSAGVSINPATLERSVDPGDVIEASINVRNISDREETYFVSPRDIIGVRDGNAPEFAPEGQEKTGYELSAWVTVDEGPYTMDPGESVSIPLTIVVPDDASPGSHFGGLFVSTEPPKLRTIGASVGYKVPSIISLKVSGDTIINAQIREFSTEKIIHGSTNVKFNVRIQNSGNVLVRPHGPLEVYNMFGSQVHSRLFNENLGGVFPGVIRTFNQSWSDDNPGFGRYQAVLSLVYEAEGGNRTIDSTVTFWILPMNIIFPVLGVLAVLLIVGYLSVRMYINRVVRQSAGSRRQLVRSRRKSKQISMLMLVSIVLLTITALFLILLLLLLA